MTAAGTRWLPWRTAMQEALYGPHGFYATQRPAAHYRTSVHTSPLFAAAVARLVSQVAAAPETGSTTQLVDVGAGSGELLTQLARLLPPTVGLVGVELRERPAALPSRVDWRGDLPEQVSGVLLANEWLDNVPLDVVEVDPSGRQRLVLVDPATGAERLGDPVTGPDAAWLARHWPLAGAPPGSRAEVGRTRDLVWAAAVSSLTTGVAVAVDYHHRRGSRPALGTLTGFRAGREVTPVPDGGCDLTAHVALDACTTSVSGVDASALLTQREALHRLGVCADLPAHQQAATDPAGYVRALARASEAAALTASNGLGGFGWLAHARGMPLPPGLAGPPGAEDTR